MKHRIPKALLTTAVLLGTACLAEAAVITVPQSNLISSTQYYTDIIGGGIGDIVVMTGGGNAPGVGVATGRNDDGFSGPINFNFTTPLNFFGVPRTSFFANNNGNISFGAGISAFIPIGPTGAAAPVISPFFGDVDTRNLASGVLHLRTDIPNQVILTWDAVGFFNSHAPRPIASSSSSGVRTTTSRWARDRSDSSTRTWAGKIRIPATWPRSASGTAWATAWCSRDPSSRVSSVPSRITTSGST